MAREPKKDWFDEFKKANTAPAELVSPATPSGSTKGSERRIHGRFEISEAQSALYKEGILSLFGIKRDNKGRTALDLSEGGARFLTHDRLAVGTKLKVVIHMDKFKDTIEAAGEVKWSYQSAKDKNDYYSGIQFIDLDSAQARRIAAMRDWFSSPQYKAVRETKMRTKRPGGGDIVMPK